MGGSKSEEFLASADVGEDTYVRCTNCDYAANVEAVQVRAPRPVPYDDAPAAHAEQTPDTPTIETLVDHLNEKFPRDDRPWAAADTLKNVLVTLKHPDGTREPIAIGVPGDREVDQKRLEGQMEPTEVEPFDEAEFKKYPALAKGYIGPGVLGEKNATGIRFLVDPRVVEGTRWVTGADVDGSHVIDLVAGRDFTPDGTIEAADVRDGDACPNCDDGTLESARGIEMGHIFQLGRMYADALDLQVLDENGKLVTVTMGSYGVGPSRAVAAIAEGTHDELGLSWPREVAPADVHLVATGKDDAVFAAAERVAHELDKQGVEVLYDDRPKVSPGVKFKDAELIGVPTIVVVGKGLADGTIEVKDRATGEREDVPADHVVDHVVGLVAGLSAGRRMRDPRPSQRTASTCRAAASTSASPVRPTGRPSCSCTASSSTTPSGPTYPSCWASRASARSRRPGRSAPTPRRWSPAPTSLRAASPTSCCRFLRMLDLTDVTLVGSDTGGAICQLVLDEDASRVGRLVLTDCDAFDSFPPFPFDLLFRLGRHPVADPCAAAAVAARRAAQRSTGVRRARPPQAHCRGEPARG